ncbi:MAG: helix-hairpin-helix domain-containing protein [Natronomonas sp.]
MSEATNPVSVVFDLQRNAIEGAKRAIDRSIETQSEFNRAVDLGPAKRLNRQSYSAVRTVVDNYFEALEAVTPEQQHGQLSETHETVIEQLDAFESSQAEALEEFEATVRDGTESADEFTAAAAELLEEHLTAVLDVHADLEAETEELVDQFESDVEELQADFETQGEEFFEAIEAQLDEFEAQVLEIEHQIEDAASAADHETSEEEVEIEIEDTPAESDAGESLESIDGIGPTYADRLQQADIGSPEALAEADPTAVATAAEVSESQAAAWIDAAE